jgi:hypothetical protein
MKKLFTLISLMVILIMSACEETSLTDVENLTLGDRYLDGFVIDNNDRFEGITIMKLEDEPFFYPYEVLAQEDGHWSVPTTDQAYIIVNNMERGEKYGLYLPQTEVSDLESSYYYQKGPETIGKIKAGMLPFASYEVRMIDRHRLRLVRTIK